MHLKACLGSPDLTLYDAIPATMTVLVEGIPYCNAAYSPTASSVDHDWHLTLTRPLFMSPETLRIELEDEGARLPAKLIKGSVEPNDFEIRVRVTPHEL